tara:strand:- start:4015 stop:4428 length:414 start_codon:yes stop_codon:yes gene_type:complete
MALLTQAQIEKIEFEINSSLQIGDKIYWNPISQSIGGFINYQNTTLLGEVTEINKKKETGVNTIGFNYSNTTNPVSQTVIENIINTPGSGFLTFKKDASVNDTSLKGYYATVNFINNDYTSKNELFSVGSEISLSSK